MTDTPGRKIRSRREGWGSLRKLSSGRWQARYTGPDGQTYTARTEDDKPLTFLTKTDARTWLANIHTQIARGQWEPPAVAAAQGRRYGKSSQCRNVSSNPTNALVWSKPTMHESDNACE